MSHGLLNQAALVRPPSTGNMTETSVSTTASGEIATGVGNATDSWISFISTVTWNCTFRDATGAAATPSTAYAFAAGTIYSFALMPENTQMNLRASGSGTIKWWRSSRA